MGTIGRINQRHTTSNTTMRHKKKLINFSWLTPFRRPYDPHLFERIHHTSRTSISELETSLEQRCRSFSTRTNHFNRLLNNKIIFFVSTTISIDISGTIFCFSFNDGHIIHISSCFCIGMELDKINHLFYFICFYKYSLYSFWLHHTTWRIEHISFP